MSQYDRVFLGGPSWGFTLANPIQTFLKKADFAGKKLYPWVTFYDHDDNYQADLEKQAHNADVQPLLELTMGILNNQSSLEKTIDSWLDHIN